MAKTIGIISIKGGVGKTSAVVGLGAVLAKDFNKKVLLVDANFSAPNLGIQVGLINPDVTLHHVLHNKLDPDKAIYESEFGFHVLPGALLYNKEINPFMLNSKLRQLKKYYDVILIDSSPTLNNEILATMIASDELYIVTTPDHVTLSTTLRAIRAAKDKHVPIAGLILNKVHGKKFELTLDDIQTISGCEVLAVLPYELEFLEALSEGKPLPSGNNTEAVREMKKFAAAILGESYNGGFTDKLKDFFRMSSKQDVNRVIFSSKRSLN